MRPMDLNLDTKPNENMSNFHLRNGIYNMNIVYMNPIVNSMGNITGSKYKELNHNNINNYASKKDENAVDKRFKTLPADEILLRNEFLGGYIFVCSNDTMQEDLKRQLFGLPPRYRDSVRVITLGLPLFLYNYTTISCMAACFGGSNIDPTTWEDKKRKALLKWEKIGGEVILQFPRVEARNGYPINVTKI